MNIPKIHTYAQIVLGISLVVGRNGIIHFSLPPGPPWPLETAVVMLSGIWMKHLTQPFDQGVSNESQNLLMIDYFECLRMFLHSSRFFWCWIKSVQRKIIVSWPLWNLLSILWGLSLMMYLCCSKFSYLGFLVERRI